MSKWVWGYLLKRIETQLMMIFSLSTMTIFLVTTVVFTGLLMNNIQEENGRRLVADAKVMSYALEQRKEGLVGQAQALASDAELIDYVVGRRTDLLNTWLQDKISNNQYETAMVVGTNGQVLARGDSPDQVGLSVSSDPLVTKLLEGSGFSTVSVTSGVLVPQVWLKGGALVSANSEMLGVVVVGSQVDSAYIDGIEEATGLSAALYGGKVLSAASYSVGGSQSRWVGTEESNAQVLETVLGKGEAYAGAVERMNVPFFGAYEPLLEADDEVVGMLFVGTPQVAAFQAAGRSIQGTFLVATILMVLSVLPALMIAKYIAYQVR